MRFGSFGEPVAPKAQKDEVHETMNFLWDYGHAVASNSMPPSGQFPVFPMSPKVKDAILRGERPAWLEQFFLERLPPVTGPGTGPTPAIMAQIWGEAAAKWDKELTPTPAVIRPQDPNTKVRKTYQRPRVPFITYVLIAAVVAGGWWAWRGR